MNYIQITVILFSVFVVCLAAFFVGCAWSKRVLGQHKHSIDKYLSLTQDSKYIVDNTIDRRMVYDEERVYKQRGKDTYGS